MILLVSNFIEFCNNSPNAVLEYSYDSPKFPCEVNLFVLPIYHIHIITYLNYTPVPKSELARKHGVRKSAEENHLTILGISFPHL